MLRVGAKANWSEGDRSMVSYNPIGGATASIMVSCLLIAATLQIFTLGQDGRAQPQPTANAAKSPAAMREAVVRGAERETVRKRSILSDIGQFRAEPAASLPLTEANQLRMA
jgi:hypothetical protein